MVLHRATDNPRPGVIEVLVDSDWAGCPVTRRSTSGGVMIVFGMCIKAWSVTQKIVARSSGEAELYAAVRGASEALGLRSMARELGWSWTIRMWTDSSACKGT
jgi:cbb3-type cytochrome oxidase subunit 1